jgi:hypothetical protein
MKPVQLQFRAARSLCWTPQRLPPKLTSKPVIQPETDAVIHGPLDEESYAQVESFVLQNSTGGAEPAGITCAVDGEDRENEPVKRPASPVTIRFSEQQKEILEAKAKNAGISVSELIRTAVLGSDYSPPLDPVLAQELLAVRRELAAHGNNLNQMARQINSGRLPSAEGNTMLDRLGRALLRAYDAVHMTLARGRERAEP